jgi:transposase
MQELAQAIKACAHPKSAKRLESIHLMLCGASFELTLKHARISERCLQLWISTFNQRGIDGLIYHPSPGRPRKVSAQTVRETILPLIDDPSLAQQHHWTGTKLCGWLNDNRELDIAYSTLMRYLHQEDYVRRIPRPMPEPPDKEKWQAQREAVHQQLKTLTQDPNATLFFGDESGFEGDPRPRHTWCLRGSNPTQGYTGKHIRQNIVGAVNPQDGQFISLIVTHNDTPTFQVFLDVMAQEAPPDPAGKKTIHLVLDNASWHKSQSLNWHHIHPVYLAPYSPDYNPIERFWQHLKGGPMAGFIARTGKELCDKLIESLENLMKEPATICSVCTPKTL